MTVSGFQVVVQDGDVSVMVEAEREVPLDALLSMQLAAGPLVRLDPALCGSPIEHPVADEIVHGVPLHLRGIDDAASGRNGFVVAQSVRRGLAWLADHWQPAGTGAVDVAVRSLRRRRAPEDEQVTRLGLLLVPTEDDDEDPCRRRCDPSPGELPRRAVIGRRDFERVCHEVPGTRGRFHVRVQQNRMMDPEGGNRIAVVIERASRVLDRSVPRWDLLTVAGHASYGRVNTRCCRDGQWTATPLARLDPRDREEFEREGRLVRFRNTDLTQGAVLRPQFLLLVPDALEGTPDACMLPAAASDLPGAFLLDSRFPLDLPVDLPLVEDPSEAWAVLLRTTAGVFLPDAGPRAVPKAFHSLAGSWLVGCTPRLEVTP